MKEVLSLWVCLVCIWVLNPSSVDGSSDSSDVSSLNTLFSGLNSPGQLTGWTSNGGDPCGQSWEGITCSGSSVTTIKLSGLGLTGTFYDMQSMTSLVELDMSNNNLGNGGQIPYNLPPNLRSLNLAGNQFTKGIPYSLSLMNSLRYLNLSHNQLQDNLTDTYAQLSNLTTMDLSFNSIKGDLPLSFSNLSSLTTLYLQNNQFTGNITALASLPLNDLNIRNNHFTGWIPDQLKKINNLQIDGNSFNSSPAPPSPPLPPSLPFTPPRRINPGHRSGGGNIPSNSSGNRKTSGIWVGVIAGIIISVLVIGAIIAFFLLRRKTQKSSIKLGEPFTPLASNEIQETKSMQTSSSFSAIVLPPDASTSLKPPPIDRHKSFEEVDISNKPVVNKIKSASAKAVVYSVANLQVATDSFSADNLIGEGSIGRVYKAQFSNGKVLAVKNVNSNALPNNSSEDFIDVVSDISQLHHPNLTQLVGYCCEHGQHLLVYEFQKNGSLHDCLHLTDENNKQLTWSTRVKIALGSARALEYLHEVCSPSVIHKNFKSANILLDAELNPHLSDSGLSSFIPNPEYQGLDHNMGAPEVVMSGQYTLKSDVYSFGVVMLELLTGRKPFDSTRPRSEQSLVRWATPRLHDIDALDKMVDPNLQGLYPAKSLSRFADVIALCIQTEPEFRPPMSEVVQAVVRLVQRANISKRMIGGEGHDSACRADDPETHDYMF